VTQNATREGRTSAGAPAAAATASGQAAVNDSAGRPRFLVANRIRLIIRSSPMPRVPAGGAR
jgi:hypothetical protein